jgi:hypothetical protein
VSCPHTHQQNVTAERKHRHIVQTGLTLLAHASISLCYWNDAFATACFLISRLPSRTIDMQTPLQRLLHESPDYTFFKVFGCACWPHIPQYNNHKLDFWSKNCLFLGYSSLHKGYKCLHVPSNRVFISRDVVFDEHVFPFANLPGSHHLPVTESSLLTADQFMDTAYALSLLSNHGAGTGHGAHLELLTPEAKHSPEVDHVDRRVPLALMHGSALGFVPMHGVADLASLVQLAPVGSAPAPPPAGLALPDSRPAPADATEPSSQTSSLPAPGFNPPSASGSVSSETPATSTPSNSPSGSSPTSSPSQTPPPVYTGLVT